MPEELPTPKKSLKQLEKENKKSLEKIKIQLHRVKVSNNYNKENLKKSLQENIL